METMLIKWLYLYKVSNSYIIAFFEDENWGRFVIIPTFLCSGDYCVGGR